MSQVNSFDYSHHGPTLSWLAAGCDLLIFCSYYSIPVSLAGLAIRQQLRISYFTTNGHLILHLKLTVVAFVVFILLCGTGHLAQSLSVLRNTDHATLVLKVLTAIVSLLTAGYLVYVSPLFLGYLRRMEITKRGLTEGMQKQMQMIYNGSYQIISTHALNPQLPTFLSVNSACGEFGYAQEQLRGTSLLHITLPEDRSAVIKAFSEAQAAPGVGVRVDYRVWQGRSSKTLHVESTISAYHYDDDEKHDWGFLVITTDVSDRKRRENEVLAQEKAKAEARQQYISSIAHDLKTPLATFLLSLDLLSCRTSLAEEQKTIVEEARVACELMSITVLQAIDFARIMDSDSLKPKRSSVSLPKLLDKCELVLGGYSKEVPVELSLAEDVHPFVLTDGEWLWQMCVNLLTNSCKYTTAGYIRLQVTQHTLADGAKRLRFAVHDTGIGVANKEELFKAFSQSQARQSQGTGLGLYSIRQKATRLGGSCGVQDNNDPAYPTGSIFFFEVPYVADLSMALGACGEVTMDNGVATLESDTDVTGIEGLRTFTSSSLDSMDIQSLGKACRDGATQALPRPPSASRNGVKPLQLPLPLPRPGSLKAILKGTKGGKHPLTSPTNVPGTPDSACGESRPLLKSSLVNNHHPPHTNGGLGLTPTMSPASSEVDLTENGVNGEDVALNKQLLIIDDTSTVRNLVGRAVSHMGYTPHYAKNGQDGLDQLKAERFALVFCDVQMPIMDGLECVRRFRLWESTDNKGNPPQPILGMSANSDPEDLKLCRECGMDGFLPKPITLKVLQQVVDIYTKPKSPPQSALQA